MNLDEIGIKYGTDKASKCVELAPCDYLRHYELFFQKFKDKKFTLLEFGVDKGCSLKTWKEYFKDANIVGVDWNKVDINEDRITVIEDDITSKELLKKIELLRGSLGIIIDDGNHAWGVQRTLFETYFPLLNSGGYFVVEDVRCDANGDYQYDRPKNFVYDRMSFTEYTKYMLELLRYPYMYRTDWIEAYLTTLPGNMKDIILEVENIFYIPGAIIISKC